MLFENLFKKNTTASAGKNTNNPKVIVIDDSELIRIYFRETFWLHALDSKYQLEACKNIKEAWAIMKDNPNKIAVIFFEYASELKKDIISSQQNALDFIRKVIQTPGYKKTKIVVFSNIEDDDFRVRAIKAGAYMCLVKGDNMPNDIKKFMETIS